MMPTAADLREQEAHAGHPTPLTGRCGIGACRRPSLLDRRTALGFPVSSVEERRELARRLDDLPALAAGGAP